MCAGDKKQLIKTSDADAYSSRKKPARRGGNYPCPPPPLPVRPRVYTQLVKLIFKSLINSKLKLSSGDSGGGGGESAPFTPSPPRYGPAGSVADDIIRVYTSY